MENTSRLQFDGVTYTIKYISALGQAHRELSNITNTTTVMGLDIETLKVGKYKDHPKAGLDPHISKIRLVQLYDPTTKTVYVFDIQLIGSTEILPLILSPNREYIAHNALFDTKVLLHKGIDLRINCSMLMAVLIDRSERSMFEPVDVDYLPVKGYGLESTIAKLFNIRIPKTCQTSVWSMRNLSREQISYAALDAILTHKVGAHLYPKICKLGMEQVYNLYVRTQAPLAEMELAGIGLNKDAHTKLIQVWERDRLSCETECKHYLGDINLNSNKQLEEAVKAKLGVGAVKDWPTTPTGAMSFTREALLLAPPIKVVDQLLKYKKLNKLISTYGETLQDKLNPVTGNIHCSYFLGETYTGRLSSRDPNLQNMPREYLRDIFTASKPDEYLVIADYSQIEMRVMAELSKDPVMLKAFRDGVDLHTLVVSTLLDIPLAEVTDEQRRKGKAINFGYGYGMGATKFRRKAFVDYGISLTEAESVHTRDAYYNLYRGYIAWGNKERAKATALGWVRTPLGKIRKLSDKEIYTRAVNTQVQGGAAEVLYETLYRLRRPTHTLTNTVHDDIILSCKEDKIEETKEALVNTMTEGMLKIFPMASTNGLVEVGVGKTWAECK